MQGYFGSGATGLALSVLLSSAGFAARAEVDSTSPDLSQLSLEELANIQVTSVSKRPQAIGEAPSAIYLITREDIARSGARSLPEILRLAPNLQVSQAGASRYVITARGHNGSPAAQNFANKLLVLIDGRTVYTPLFSGVYWDMQDVLPHDIDRIEVISGPGATLWGANAVNGVINITTRGSAETQGGVVALSAGSQQRRASLRYGGRLSDSVTWRAYASTFLEDDTRAVGGGSADDHWSKPQAGFRIDWSPSDRDMLTIHGDIYEGYGAQPGGPAQDIEGRNLTARWARTWPDGSALQVQAYYDRMERGDERNSSGFFVDTYDVDLQHSLSLGDAHRVVWGGGYRVSRYRIAGTPSLFFDPGSADLNLFNLFVQDSVALTPALTLVLGAKVEDGPYAGPVLMPNARVSWTPRPEVTVWGAVSRAVRAPTPFDREVVEVLGGQTFLIGGAEFRGEKLTAYEMGLKLQKGARASFSATAFYNDYDDLRNIEIAPGGFLPLRWGNGLKGHTYGVEAWGAYRVTPHWRLTGAVTYQDQKFRFKPGAARILGPGQVGNDPKYQASLGSSFNLGQRVTLDATARYVSAFPQPRLPAYVELNSRVGWAVTDAVELSVTGRNLLHARHREYTDGAAIPRSVSVDLLWRF